jgi:translation initiation factor 2 subunit 3
MVSKKNEQPIQAEVNIGLIGHVDHGKCIALDEPVLLNNDFCIANDIVDRKCRSVQPTLISPSERLFDIPNFRTYSLDPLFNFNSVPAKVFIQNYSGKMVQIVTKKGKRIKASPEHPLLVNNGHAVEWKKMSKLKHGDYIGSVKKIPDSSAVKDPFPEWLGDLSKEYWVITRERALLLEQKTKGFTFFDSLTTAELNEARILYRSSFYYLEKKYKIHGIASSYKKGKLTRDQKNKLLDFFASERPTIPKKLLINLKSNTKCFAEINETGFSEEVLRFIALVVAEGYLTNRSIRFSQEKNVLLDFYLQFVKKTFGQPAVFRGKIDYHLDNKGVADFLMQRYGMKIGNSYQAGIPEWIFNLPNALLALFLRAFFSAEGTVNLKSKQLSISQANRNSILLLSYSLKRFGIDHSVHPIWKVATNSKNGGKRKYWQLSLSNITSLTQFRNVIGFELDYKSEKLEKLCERKKIGKESDTMVPINHKLLSELAFLTGLKKHGHLAGKALKRQKWFFAHQDCSYKNTVSEKKLNEIIDFFNDRIRLMEFALENTLSKENMQEWSVSKRNIADTSNLTLKIVSITLNNKVSYDYQNRVLQLNKAWKIIISERLEKAKTILSQLKSLFPSNVEWDRIATVKSSHYEGPILDLQVPGYHNFIAGMGGIISHNTSLTQALSGKWTDTHSEELKRGISIRLGYADACFYEYEGAEGFGRFGTKPEKNGKKGKLLRKVSFIDSPGHETLMTTMLSGSALMNGAVLVIAANEPCPQPRTAEHLMALQIGGIKNIVAVQNKVDLVDEKRANASYQEIQKFLKEYGYEKTPIVPISANFNANIDVLIQHIQEYIPTPKYETKKPLKMYLSRSFDINKPGTEIEKIKGGVLGGSVVQGILKEKQKVQITPGFDGKPFTIEAESINIEGGNLKEAHPGGLLAVGTKLDPGVTSMDKFKGQIICEPHSLPEPTSVIKAEWNELNGLIGNPLPAPKVKELLVLTIGTNTLIGEIASIKKKQMEIVLRTKMTVEKDQKIAISRREESAWRLSGYGVVL